MQAAIAHKVNPLHVYCRLRDIGLPEPIARRISKGYETITLTWRKKYVKYELIHENRKA